MPADVRLVCDEGEFETLLADLALHRLDVVLTDRAATVGSNLKVFSTRLGDFATGLFATPELARPPRRRFPGPAQWRADAAAHPPQRAARGASTAGWNRTGARRLSANSRTAPCSTPSAVAAWHFPAPIAVERADRQPAQCAAAGRNAGGHEQIYAISNERRIRHPAVEACAATPQGATVEAGV